MNKLDFLYSERRDEVYDYYKEVDHVDEDIIEEVNDKLIDSHFKKENFENPLEEFYIICSMCAYMTSIDVYDDYFFSSFDELLAEYNDGLYDDYFKDKEKDKEILSHDISNITEFILKDKDEQDYYNSIVTMDDKDE